MGETGKPLGMFLQDPALPELHDDFDLAATGEFLEGAGSSRFCIRDEGYQGTPTPPVRAPLNWPAEDLSFARFEGDGLVDDPWFHQVNCFAVASRTLEMVEGELGRAVSWQGGGPLVIRPHAFEGGNAFYDASAPSLNFGFFSSAFRRTPVWCAWRTTWCRTSWGTPCWTTSGPGCWRACTMTVAPCTSPSVTSPRCSPRWAHEPVVRRMFADGGGDPRRPSVLTRLGEEFGLGAYGGGHPFLRSPLDVLHCGPDAPGEAHARSAIWTGAIYELMARLFEARTPPGGPATFDEFAAAMAEASKWTRGMLYRTLHYLPTPTITLPLVARLLVEADRRVFPDDPEFRDIARAVFTERGLWDESIDLSAPDVGTAFAGMLDADAKTLSRAVMAHAEALRIPLGHGARILTPTLTSTTRRVDRVKNAKGRSKLREITGRYLSYGYGIELHFQLPVPGQLPLDLLVEARFGGTLVLDEAGNPVLLAADPAFSADLASFEAQRTALTTLADRLRPTLIAAAAGTDPRLELIAGKLVPRSCDLSAHVRGLHGPPALCPSAPIPTPGVGPTHAPRPAR